jgi:hypothetical protein
VPIRSNRAVEIQRWRAKAEEVRTAAETVSNAVARDSLLEMAERYERLAAHFEQFEARKLSRTA